MFRTLLAFTLILLTPFVVHTEEVDITVDGENYSIDVSTDYDFLKERFLQTVELYIQESSDFEELDKQFEDYKKSSDELIKKKNNEIQAKDKLLDQKDLTILELENKIKILERQKTPILRWIPSAIYVLAEDETGFGVGVSALFWEKFFTQVQVQKPLQVSFGIGWCF